MYPDVMSGASDRQAKLVEDDLRRRRNQAAEKNAGFEPLIMPLLEILPERVGTRVGQVWEQIALALPERLEEFNSLAYICSGSAMNFRSAPAGVSFMVTPDWSGTSRVDMTAVEDPKPVSGGFRQRRAIAKRNAEIEAAISARNRSPTLTISTQIRDKLGVWDSHPFCWDSVVVVGRDRGQPSVLPTGIQMWENEDLYSGVAFRGAIYGWKSDVTATPDAAVLAELDWLVDYLALAD